MTIVVALTGCALGTPKVQEIANYPGKSLLLSSDAAQVSIDEKEYTRLDDSTSDGGPTLKSIWSTGALWKRAFIGDPTGNAVFEIISAVVTETSHIPGFSTRVSYIIEGRLIYNGVKFPVHAKGTRAAAIPTRGLFRYIVEAGIKDAANQSRAIIKANAS